MTGPGPRSRMTMRADLERDTSTGEDGRGHPVLPVFTAYLQDVPCYLWNQRRPEIVDGEKVGMVEELRSLFPAATLVTEKDRLARVTDRTGKVLWDGPLGVESVIRMDSHLELKLTLIEGP